MIHAYLYRLFGVAGCVAVAANISKHGWHPVSIAPAVVFSALVFSLGVSPDKRTMSWEVRYLITSVGVLSLAAFRSLR